jgi:hypothetical protein
MRPAAPNRNVAPMVYTIGILLLFVAMGVYARTLEARKREQKLGEATLGQIDTGSFMLKLALLGGARGVAADVLWLRAEDLKKAHEWDRLKATVDLITKLQPHFLSVWTFQGWNLAYNVSVEWDAPEDKYEWIKQGIKFLKEGVKKNERSADLVWDTAWTYYHKLGFSDEAIILRRLFRDDDDEPFKTYVDLDSGIPYRRDDNFQLGYGWFTNAVEMVDAGATVSATGIQQRIEYVDKQPQRKGKPGDLAFRSMPAHAQSRYASGLEKESVLGVEAKFGEEAQLQWGKALNEWIKFGQYVFKAPNEVWIGGKRVSDQPIQIDDVTNPERYGKLHENQKYWTNRWADQMNYRYWKDRCAAEMEKDGVDARRYFYEGTKALKAGRLVREKLKSGEVRDGAVENYQHGLALWEKLLERHADYRNDDLNMRDTGLIVRRYLYALRQAGVPEPEHVPFKDKARAVQGDNTVDPFDALEMIKTPRSGQVAPSP